ncbi:MAG: macro domain-containing protein, partial [bacterium]
MQHGGGVAGAISRKGGPQIQKESSKYVKEHGIVKTGQCCYTGAGKLPCKYVIHAVGPVWNDYIPKEKNVQLLHSAV